MAQYQAGEWPIDYSLAECAPFEQPNASGLQWVAEEAAVNLLWNWTNHMFGSTEVIYRPEVSNQFLQPSTWEGRGPRQMAPWGSSASWINGPLSRQYPHETSKRWALPLPGKPQEVLAVQIEEFELEPEVDYRLYEDSLLIATGYWPTFQNMRLPLGNVGTWGVTYVKGLPVPKGGQVAAGVLACELAKAIVKDSTCRLPVRLQILVAGGGQETLKDTYGAYMSFGKTGLWIIDSWVDSVLTSRIRPTVRSVDLPGLR